MTDRAENEIATDGRGRAQRFTGGHHPMSITPGSRTAKHEIVRRIDLRRHAPMACLVSIVAALIPSIELERPAPPRGDGSLPAATFEITARLCLAHDGCGSLTARINRER
jgi:hypothetical protein